MQRRGGLCGWSHAEPRLGKADLMSSIRIVAGLVAAFSLFAGCSSTTTIEVPVEPRVDLSQYQSIGLVTFASNDADDEVRALCTQQFMQSLQEAQPGTRILELGTEQRVLNSVNRSKLDPKTLQAIGEQHGVEVVVLGQLNMNKVKAQIELSTLVKTLSVKSEVDALLSAKLVETASGATMWSDSAKMRATVANASFNDRGKGVFGASDPKAVYGEMVDCMVYEITDDFRTHYITKRVPKEQLHQQTVNAPEQDYP